MMAVPYAIQRAILSPSSARHAWVKDLDTEENCEMPDAPRTYMKFKPSITGIRRLSVNIKEFSHID
jgi:hypothetical protein